MTPFARKPRRASARGLLLVSALCLFPLLTGCGSAPKLMMSLDRPAENKGPIWVGVYYLSNESALDGKSIAELIDKPEATASIKGVLDQEVFSIQPGKDRSLLRENYEKDPKLGGLATILVVANFPKPGECARQKLAVKKGDDIKYHISVTEKCLEVSKGK